MFVVGGESLVDLVPTGKSVDGAVERVPHPGGSPFNCAIALSKLGNRTGFLCPISQDAYGDALLAPLAEAGVEVLLSERVASPTTKAVVSFNEKMQASYEFSRGAERDFTRQGLIAALPEKVEVFQIGGFCPIEPEDAAIWRDVAIEAERRGATLTIDPNVRPSLVADFAGYKQRLGGFLDMASLIKVSEEDLAALDPSKSIEEHADRLLGRPKCELVVVTLGEKGSRAFTRAGTAAAGIHKPPVFGDTVGAGDTLMAGIITLLSEMGHLRSGGMAGLDDAALARVLRFGAVAAGINCGRVGCNPPTRAEVDAVLAAG